MRDRTTDDANDLPECWPALTAEAWGDTRDTLHMWTQIVGKVRLALTPHLNHWWNVPLYVSARGLTTSPMPYQERVFEIDFDFIDHLLLLKSNDGVTKSLPLTPMPVAEFYRQFMELLRSEEIDVHIWRTPVELPDPIPFDQDRVHASYDKELAHSFWQILVTSNRVLQQFRGRFIGKSSPVHFFWGSFDLAVTRFSGRRAPDRPGADSITREAYSHEVSSVGFWPGNKTVAPLYYSYTSPEPQGFRDRPVAPSAALYDKQLSEFVVPYKDIRRNEKPSAALLEFCQSTYEAGADLAKWDRVALERQLG